MLQDLCATGLMADDRRTAYLHRLQRRDTKRFADGRHDIDVAHGQHLLYLLAAHEAREMELIGDTAFGYEIDHLVHLITRTGHDETNAVGLAQHACCGFDEVLRTFLHRDTTEESNEFVFPFRLGELFGMLQRLYGIMHRADLARVDSVFLDDGVAREVTYAHDMIRLFHTAFLDGEDGGVDVTATTVEVGRMDVDDQRLTADMLGEDAGGVG